MGQVELVLVAIRSTRFRRIRIEHLTIYTKDHGVIYLRRAMVVAENDHCQQIREKCSLSTIC